MANNHPQQTVNDDFPTGESQERAVVQCPNCGSIAVGTPEIQCCGGAMEKGKVEDPAVEPEYVDILRNVFGMNETEFQICIELIQHGPMTATEVADAIDCDPSYANRRLNHLQEIHVVQEESYILEAGGRVSAYRHTPIPEIEQAWKQELLAWTAEAIRIIDEEMVHEKAAAIESVEEILEELDSPEERTHLE